MKLAASWHFLDIQHTKAWRSSVRLERLQGGSEKAGGTHAEQKGHWFFIGFWSRKKTRPEAESLGFFDAGHLVSFRPDCSSFLIRDDNRIFREFMLAGKASIVTCITKERLLSVQNRYISAMNEWTFMGGRILILEDTKEGGNWTRFVTRKKAGSPCPLAQRIVTPCNISRVSTMVQKSPASLWPLTSPGHGQALLSQVLLVFTEQSFFLGPK